MKEISSRIYTDFFKKYGDPSYLWPQWCSKNKDNYLMEIVALGAILVQRGFEKTRMEEV